MIDVVYFARRDGLVKIGTTGDVRSRMFNLANIGAPGMPLGPVELLATMPGNRVVEKAMHEMFAGLRVHGEWFAEREPLIGFIAAVAIAGTAMADLTPIPQRLPADGELTITEAVNGAVLPWTRHNAVMRMRRARAAGRPCPVPVGKRGAQAFVYRRSDLEAWLSSEVSR